MPDTPTGTVRPPCLREDAEAVIRALHVAGHIAFFAGGCVRDLLLGHDPKDFDIATDAPPARVRSIFPRTQAVGTAFGVILVRQATSVIEVATFRADISYEDGRRPTAVRFTSAEEDAKRRDFTINGLFLDPLESRIIDYVGGQQDLKDKVLRAIGDPDLRFEEDHLRLLRAVRFAARFGLAIEQKTAEAIAHHGPRLKRISPERIAEELRLMLTPMTRGKAWRLLWDFHLILEIFRYLPSPRFVALDDQRSIFLHCAPERSIDFGLSLAAAMLCFRRHTATETDVAILARDEAVSLTRAMRQTLHLSNDEQEEIRQTLLSTGRLIVEQNMTLASLKRIIAGKYFPNVRQLLDAIARCGLHTEKIARLRASLAEAEKTEVAPEPLLTGEHLIAMGLQPGKLFKVILNQVYDAQLENRVSTREQALELARRIVE